MKWIAPLLIVALCATASVDAAPAREQSSGAAAQGTDTLTGADALAYLKKLQERNDALAVAAARLRQKGFQPTSEVVVTRSGVAPARGRAGGRAPEVQRLQQSVSDGSGELAFWSWSDGDASTWEGVIYFHDYTDGADAVWNAQLSQSYDAVWEEYVSGSGPPNDPELMTAVRSPRAPQIASTSPEAIADALRSQDVVPVQTARSVRNWVACMIASIDQYSFLLCPIAGPWCLDPPAAIRCARRHLRF